MPFSTPPKPLNAPTPFKVEIPEKELEEFKTLLRLSKVPKATFESLQEDGRFGVSHKWISEAKRVWLDEFDWFVSLYFSLFFILRWGGYGGGANDGI
jgi:microsomal epoxide hydrolase